MSAENRSPSDHGVAEIERQVLPKISPSTQALERVREARERLIQRAETVAKQLRSPVRRCIVAGSAARGTFLIDRLDIDLFLLFPPELDRKELEARGMELARGIFPDGETRYAEHPYLRGRFEGFGVDAVPGYAVEDPARPLSAVDRTPFHNEYLSARLTADLVGQVRLLKQFLRSLGIYGSEARTGGFSGYLQELLIIRFGGLRPLLEAARGWRIPVRLESTPGARPRVPEDVALVLDDPVDPHRNVASALTPRNLALFILASGNFLDQPNVRWFDLRPRPRLEKSTAQSRIVERGTFVLAVTLARPALVDDILYPQLKKAERAIAEAAERLDFQVVGTASAAGENRLLVLMETTSDQNPAVRRQDGPPAGIDRVGAFLTKWTEPSAPVYQGPFVTDEGRLAVEARRSERRLDRLLVSELARLPLGKDLREPTPGSWNICPVDSLETGSDLEEALAELLDKKLPWVEPPPSAAPKDSGPSD